MHIGAYEKEAICAAKIIAAIEANGETGAVNPGYNSLRERGLRAGCDRRQG